MSNEYGKPNNRPSHCCFSVSTIRIWCLVIGFTTWCMGLSENIGYCTPFHPLVHLVLNYSTGYLRGIPHFQMHPTSFWLVVSTSEKYESQLGWLFPIFAKIKNGNQTTNQFWLIINQPTIWSDSAKSTRIHTVAGQIPHFRHHRHHRHRRLWLVVYPRFFKWLLSLVLCIYIYIHIYNIYY